MPNAMQKFARLIVKRWRHVTSSSTSPPVIAPDVTIDDEAAAKLSEEATPKRDTATTRDEKSDVAASAHGDDVTDLRRAELRRPQQPAAREASSRKISSVSTSCESCASSQGCSSGGGVEAAATTTHCDEIIDSIRGLRIEDALEESRKIRDTQDRKPPSARHLNTRRLMREYRSMQRASAESDGAFQVELAPLDDADEQDADGAGCDVAEWVVRFFKFDEQSSLWKSMRQYGVECVQFRVSFPGEYPFAPPFVRLVAPYIENGFVMTGGAICLEVLTAEGWSSAYTMEALLVQVAAALAHGGAVVSKHQRKKQHKLTRRRAETEFQRIVKIHSKYGWVNLEKDEG